MNILQICSFMIKKKSLGVRVEVFNATFNNISAISWWSVLLLEKTTDLPQVTDQLMLYQVFHAMSGIRTHNVSGDR